MSRSSEKLKYIFSIVLKGLLNQGKICSRDKMNHNYPFIIYQNLQDHREIIKNGQRFLDYVRHGLNRRNKLRRGNTP